VAGHPNATTVDPQRSVAAELAAACEARIARGRHSTLATAIHGKPAFHPEEQRRIAWSTYDMSHPAALRSRATASLSLVVTAAALIGACSGGGTSTRVTSSNTAVTSPTSAPDSSVLTPTGAPVVGSGSGPASQLQAYESCMASHGEPLPSLPSAPGASAAGGPPQSLPTGATAAGGPSGSPPAAGAGAGAGVFLRGLNQNDPKVMAAYNACKSQIPAALVQGQQQRSQALSAFISCMSDHGVTISSVQAVAGTTPTTIDQSSSAYQTCKALLPTGGAFGPGRASTTTTAA